MEAMIPLIMILVVLVISGFRVVHQQSVCIVETFGKFSRVLLPGLNWIVPIVQRVAKTVELRVYQHSAHIEVKSSDNMFVRLPVHLMLRVQPDRANDAYYKLGEPEKQISVWVLNALRSITASMELSALYEQRDALVKAVEAELTEKLSQYGYVIEGVLVDQPMLSEEVQSAFNRVVASQREREAAEQETEAKRIRIVGEARADAESQQLRAHGLAQARMILAKGLSEAVQKAASNGLDERDVLDLLMETNRLDTIKQAAEFGRLVVMDLRSSVATPIQIPVGGGEQVIKVKDRYHRPVHGE